MKIQKKEKFLASKQGFTLVELLIVIAIIGILASVIVVNLSSQRTRARQTAAIQAVQSGLPIAIQCSLKGGSVTVKTPTLGGQICSDSSDTWPSSLEGCLMDGNSTHARIYSSATVDCGADVNCSFTDGSCK